jgi:hypothetical protein
MGYSCSYKAATGRRGGCDERQQGGRSKWDRPKGDRGKRTSMCVQLTPVSTAALNVSLLTLNLIAPECVHGRDGECMVVNQIIAKKWAQAHINMGTADSRLNRSVERLSAKPQPQGGRMCIRGQLGARGVGR